MAAVVESSGLHPRVTFRPAPGWAQAEPFQRPPAMPPELIDHGLCYWRVDNYADLLMPEPVFFTRVVMEVVGSEGLQGASAFDASFDPSCEQLAVHHVRVIRPGQPVRELAQPENFEILRRERNLERAIYDGRVSVHLVIPDLRVGDIIDACYAVIGSSPVLRDAFCAHLRFQWPVPIDVCRFRLFAPASRPIATRAWGRPLEYAETQLNQDNLLRTWTADGFPAFAYESGAPPWWIGHAQLLVTDEITWAKVSDLFRPGYADAGPLPADLEAVASEIAAGVAEPRMRAVLALKLVQRELRYLTVGIGDGGYVPRSLAEIWRTRFGDCKDSSRLLTALLRRLGLEASPALVNTGVGWTLNDGPPHVGAFDHCIVRLRLDGRSWWLDPARGLQGGTLDRLAQARFGWALPLVEAAALEWMEEDEPESVYEQHTLISFGPELNSPARLESRSVYRGWMADNVRSRLENEGSSSMERAYREHHQARHGALEVIEPLRIEDSETLNALSVSEAYRLEAPWTLTEDGKAAYFGIAAEAVILNLPGVDEVRRAAPVDLGLPRRIVETVILELSTGWPAAQGWRESGQVGGASAASEVRLSQGGRRLELSAMVEVRERSLPAELAPALMQMGETIARASIVTLSHMVRGGRFARLTPLSRVGAWLRGNLILVLVLILALGYAAWRLLGLPDVLR
jgi:hypothetical protein